WCAAAPPDRLRSGESLMTREPLPTWTRRALGCANWLCTRLRLLEDRHLFTVGALLLGLVVLLAVPPVKHLIFPIPPLLEVPLEEQVLVACLWVFVVTLLTIYCFLAVVVVPRPEDALSRSMVQLAGLLYQHWGRDAGVIAVACLAFWGLGRLLPATWEN